MRRISASNARVRNEWICISATILYLHAVDRGNLTLFSFEGSWCFHIKGQAVREECWNVRGYDHSKCRKDGDYVGLLYTLLASEITRHLANEQLVN